MDSNNQPDPHASASAGFVTAASSTATIQQAVSSIKIVDSRDTSPENRGVKYDLSQTDDHEPHVPKKNREHLPKESKLTFFELKKYYRKKA